MASSILSKADVASESSFSRSLPPLFVDPHACKYGDAGSACVGAAGATRAGGRQRRRGFITAGGHRPRRQRPGHGASHSHFRTDHRRRTLDENVYSTIPAITGFIQQEPNEGSRRPKGPTRGCSSTMRTSMWRRAAGTRNPSGEVANEMRRDGPSTNDNESFGVDVRYVPRPPQRLPLSNDARRRTVRRRRSPTKRDEPRLEHGLGRAQRPDRRRLDRRNGDSVQIASLPRRANKRGASTSSASCAGKTR